MSDDKNSKTPYKLSEYVVLTLNAMGGSSSYMDQYAKQFIKYASQQSSPVLDLGASYGFLTHEVLKTGAKVIANDLEPRHLQILLDNTPEEQRKRLTLLPGRFPYEINLPAQSISGCYASRVLGHLSSIELQQGLDKIFTWLKNDAKLFIISMILNSSSPVFEKLNAVYNKRVREHEQWPGYISGIGEIIGGNLNDFGPDTYHYFDKATITRELNRAGFIVEKTECYIRKDMPDWELYSGEDTMAVIARKP